MVVGAHCPGRNTGAVGTGGEGARPPAEPTAQPRRRSAFAPARYDIPPSAIFGHRDHRDTLYPGDKLYALLPRPRQEVARALGRPDRFPGNCEKDDLTRFRGEITVN
ncbi:hypothetical protein GCM10009660_12160 [Catellatospora bangladeshensis]